MAKFLTLAEAAQQLGVAPDEINELRQQGKLNGYRDGASWKFKPEDVQRAADRLAQDAAHGDSDDSGEISLDEVSLDDISLDDISLEDIQSIGEEPVGKSAKDSGDIDIGLSTDDIVLLSEFELGESGPSASQTVIGHPGLPLSPQESDIQLRSLFEDEGTGASGTQLGIPGAPSDPGASAIKLDAGIFDEDSSSKTTIGAPGQGLSPDASAIKLDVGIFEDSTSKTTIGAPGQGLSPDESAIQLRADDFDVASPSSTVIGRPGKSDSGIPSHVELHEPVSDSVFDLDLEDAPPAAAPPKPPTPGGSSIRFDAPPAPDPVLDSGIVLADENSDDEFVLGGPGSDITISSADSGISLVDPSDSGLSLDAPLELSGGGSAVGESSFELTGSGEDLGSAADFDSDEVMDLKTGDEFLLTPSTAEGEDSSEDSGSQVIAIDAEGAFEDSDSGMFGSMGDSSQSALLEEDVSAGAGPLGGPSMGAASPAMAGGMAVGGPIAAETPYPAWVVVMMFFCVIFMSLCGMMMYDLVRNMWSWNAPYTVNSSIMDLIMGLFGS
ncbi:MAG TPA: helix-turn-helix domain-containing protein [Pirellulales bacterium]